ncbi:MAG: outer membrane protein assembly factor BamD, partial [Nannocystaceae bacterium]
MLRYSLALLALTIATPAGAAGPPKARKSSVTTSAARTKATPKAGRRSPRLGRRIRKGPVPDAAARVAHGKLRAPTKTQVASKRARKPLRLKGLRKATKVSFSACAASPAPEAPRDAAPKAGMDAAVAGRSYRWPKGATLEIGFVDGSQPAREAVAELAKQWTDHANLQFHFNLGTPPAKTDILISFDSLGCTSALGTTSIYRSENGEPSMHLCHMDQQIGTDRFRRVVLHEFGHAIGLEHEHQSPEAKHEWNKEAVYQYYEQFGWSRSYTDQWVFRQISPMVVDASEYDPDSVMHYFFPPEFTRNGIAFGGNNELSDIDKSFIAEVYPGRGTDAPAKRRYERKLAVRNSTGRAIEVQSIVQTRSGNRFVWAPGDELDAAPKVRVPAGEERLLDGSGRRARLIARSLDGRSTWSEWTDTPLRIAPRAGYLDPQTQTYVVVVDGPPDAPPGQTSEQLYASAAAALQRGEHADARALFGEFLAKFPKDDMVPWARFNTVASWYEDGRLEEAMRDAYELIVAHPNADAASYAWFYGGLAALGSGWCDGARSYFEYAQDASAGLPQGWRDSAAEYLEAIDQ